MPTEQTIVDFECLLAGAFDGIILQGSGRRDLSPSFPCRSTSEKVHGAADNGSGGAIVWLTIYPTGKPRLSAARARGAPS